MLIAALEYSYPMLKMWPIFTDTCLETSGEKVCPVEFTIQIDKHGRGTCIEIIAQGGTAELELKPSSVLCIS